MKTTAVRMYGAGDLRLESFELPPMADDEIVARVVSDSLCMSTYKASQQGGKHKRVPTDIADRPIIIGHEFCGEILEVGSKWRDRFAEGQRFTIQPALNYRGSLAAPGYSYPFVGGDATYIVIPSEVMEMDCLLPYDGDGFFRGSLAEPFSCVAGAFHANYHVAQGTYVHAMGSKPGGRVAILAGTGPMGNAAIDYALHVDPAPSLVVVTGRTQSKLDRASKMYSREDAAARGIELRYELSGNPGFEARLASYADGTGYDDVFVFVPTRSVVELGSRLLAKDGCLNFFAGPAKTDFVAEINFYDVHYTNHHYVATSGGNTDDMREALDLMARDVLKPAALVSHVGGLNAVVETTLNLPNVPGAKKLIYTHKSLPLFSVDDLPQLASTSDLYGRLNDACARHGGLWNEDAERIVLAEARPI